MLFRPRHSIDEHFFKLRGLIEETFIPSNLPSIYNMYIQFNFVPLKEFDSVFFEPLSNL